MVSISNIKPILLNPGWISKITAQISVCTFINFSYSFSFPDFLLLFNLTATIKLIIVGD